LPPCDANFGFAALVRAGFRLDRVAQLTDPPIVTLDRVADLHEELRLALEADAAGRAVAITSPVVTAA